MTSAGAGHRKLAGIGCHVSQSLFLGRFYGPALGRSPTRRKLTTPLWATRLASDRDCFLLCLHDLHDCLQYRPAEKALLPAFNGQECLESLVLFAGHAEASADLSRLSPQSSTEQSLAAPIREPVAKSKLAVTAVSPSHTPTAPLIRSQRPASPRGPLHLCPTRSPYAKLAKFACCNRDCSCVAPGWRTHCSQSSSVETCLLWGLDKGTAT